MTEVNSNAVPDIAVRFQVLYDTPKGEVLLTVQGYTHDAAVCRVKCQIGYRPAGGSEQRSALLSLDAALATETKQGGQLFPLLLGLMNFLLHALVLLAKASVV